MVSTAKGPIHASAVVMAALVLTAIAAASPAVAGDVMVTPYIWFEGLQGDGLVAGKPYFVDPDPFELDSYDGGGAVEVQAIGDRWAFFGGFAAIDSDQTIAGSSTVAASQTMIDAALGYRLGDSEIYFIAGARSLDYDVTLTTAALGRTTDSSDWVDPFVGFWYRADAEKWGVSVEGDYGVGGDSDQIFNIGSLVYWHFSHRVSLTLGYRALDMHYQEGDFKMHSVTRGIVAGLAFRFQEY